VTCKKAQEFLAQKDCTAKTQVNARKEPIDRDGTLKLMQTVSRVIAVKGKKVLDFSLKKNQAPAEDLMSAVIGPSGNLRAPAIRRGKTLVVGFHPDAYGEVV
jgi:arsenate reductase-like glutaredoxin family protein